jgi:hypothetical protein
VLVAIPSVIAAGLFWSCYKLGRYLATTELAFGVTLLVYLLWAALLLMGFLSFYALLLLVSQL